MSMPIVAIRPEPGCSATVAAGREIGLTIQPCPLFEIRTLPWDAPPPERVDALLFGSANAIRHGGDGLAAYRGKPVYAVGEVTAQAAREAGFPVAAVGSGGLQHLLDSEAGLPPHLLRIAGAEHVALHPPHGVTIETRIAYENAPLPLPAFVAERLAGGALVLLHSAAAARHFASECARMGLPRASIALVALGPRIAAAAGSGWRKLENAPQPREAALLALVHEMCHEPRQF